MTIDEFLDKVPWAEMDMAGILVRHRLTGACPICAALGHGDDKNDLAIAFGQGAGLDYDDAYSIVNAADDSIDFDDERELNLRDEMLRRIEAARPTP